MSAPTAPLGDIRSMLASAGARSSEAEDARMRGILARIEPAARSSGFVADRIEIRRTSVTVSDAGITAVPVDSSIRAGHAGGILACGVYLVARDGEMCLDRAHLTSGEALAHAQSMAVYARPGDVSLPVVSRLAEPGSKDHPAVSAAATGSAPAVGAPVSGRRRDVPGRPAGSLEALLKMAPGTLSAVPATGGANTSGAENAPRRGGLQPPLVGIPRTPAPPGGHLVPRPALQDTAAPARPDASGGAPVTETRQQVVALRTPAPAGSATQHPIKAAVEKLATENMMMVMNTIVANVYARTQDETRVPGRAAEIFAAVRKIATGEGHSQIGAFRIPMLIPDRQRIHLIYRHAFEPEAHDAAVSMNFRNRLLALLEIDKAVAACGGPHQTHLFLAAATLHSILMGSNRGDGPAPAKPYMPEVAALEITLQVMDRLTPLARRQAAPQVAMDNPLPEDAAPSMAMSHDVPPGDGFMFGNVLQSMVRAVSRPVRVTAAVLHDRAAKSPESDMLTRQFLVFENVARREVTIRNYLNRIRPEEVAARMFDQTRMPLCRAESPVEPSRRARIG